MKLPLGTFKTIVANTPLVSIDLVIKNEDGAVLLGKRVNKPAKDYWFVPGGRIFKNESLQEAFQRILVDELNVEVNLDLNNVKFLGVFEHFYNDSVFEDVISTHYVVLGYELNVKIDTSKVPLAQHEDYCWLSVDSLKINEKVHLYTKAYFQ